jgi:hypothetical protein
VLDRVRLIRARPDAHVIDALAGVIAKAAASARVAEARQNAGNTVTFRLLQKKWIAAEALAQEQIRHFRDALLGDPELQADDRFPQLQAEANRFETLTPDDGGQLTVALGILDDADTADRPAAQKRAVAILESYEADLAQAQALESLQGIADEFYDGQPFSSGLRSVLADLGKELVQRI